MRLVFIAISFLASIFLSPVHAESEAQAIAQSSFDFSSLTLTDSSAVTDVLDPLRIHLANGKFVQFANLDVPGFTPYEAGEYAEPITQQLSELLLNKQVRLYQSKKKENRRNRLGHHLAQVQIKANNSWVQQILLAEGYARVRPSAVHTEMAEDMLKIENEARRENKGLWTNPRYAVQTPETASQFVNSWTIVEGKILSVALVKNKAYLNFGEDWKKDFTIVIDSKIRSKMSRSGINVHDLAHKTVRVRGWVEDYNGPNIELLDSVWLEVLHQ